MATKTKTTMRTMEMKKPEVKATPLNKGAFLDLLAEKSGFNKKDVTSLLESLVVAVAEQLRSSGAVIVPGLVKLKAKSTPALPERPGINPFTKEPITCKARPASTKITVAPHARLKADVVA